MAKAGPPSASGKKKKASAKEAKAATDGPKKKKAKAADGGAAKKVKKKALANGKHDVADFADDNAEWLRPKGKAAKNAAAAPEPTLDQFDDDEAAMDEEDGEEEDDAQVEAEIEQELREKKLGKKPDHFEVGMNRVTRGEGDLTQIKQEIEDDVALLQSWRNSDRAERGNRSHAEVLEDLAKLCSTYYGYAPELAGYFLQMFKPEEAIQFFEANEKPRPTTIRTNSLKTRRRLLIQDLVKRGMQLDAIGDWTKVGLTVFSSEVAVGGTPEYLGGKYMVQSASSLIPVMALAPQPKETVLDMAAAPGGKTTHIGQLMQNTGVLYANDLRADRCVGLIANVHRLGLTNTVVCNYDGTKLPSLLPMLDRVLLDAPCSGSGIIARDPSIKVKRQQGDFDEHSQLQKQLLCAAVDCVNADSKTGGFIVYSTCSVAVEENECVIDYILKARNVKLVSFDQNVTIGSPGFKRFKDKRFDPSLEKTRRFFPHVHNMDGFYVAKLKKISNDIPKRPKRDHSKAEAPVVWGEEMWKPELMEAGMDFPDDDVVPAPGSAKPPKEAKAKKAPTASAPAKKAVGKKAAGKVKGGIAKANGKAKAGKPAKGAGGKKKKKA
jgi:ribosomal RNA methyltransferase Nop2